MAVSIDLSGRVAFVTGGASGIGRATVLQLARAGARVVSLDREHEAAVAGVRQCRLDVRDAAAIERTIALLEAEDIPPDILVNAAGITSDGVVWKLSDSAWNDVIDVNLSGAFRMTRACAVASSCSSSRSR